MLQAGQNHKIQNFSLLMASLSSLDFEDDEGECEGQPEFSFIP